MDFLLPALSIIGLPMQRPVVFFCPFPFSHFPLSSHYFFLGECLFPESQNITLASLLAMICRLGDGA